MIPFSVLDLSPVAEGSTAGDALRRSLDLAQHAEVWGYRRYWLAEHHGMRGIASAATSVVIGYVANGTKTIRVGSGGIMLPNHSPLVIAEQFGTLASLFPGRIDLGLGRAPGTDQATARALRRDANTSAESFPRDVRELQEYLGIDPVKGFALCPEPVPACPSGCWARVFTARSWRPRLVCPSPSPRTLRRGTCRRPSPPIANISSPRPSLQNRMR
jgi:luciferase family oxidoreductase group 1